MVILWLLVIMRHGSVNTAESVSTCCKLLSVITDNVVPKCTLSGMRFSNRFQHVHVPVRQESTGPVIPEKSSVKKSSKFLGDVWQRLAIGKLIPQSGYSEILYDFYYVSVKDIEEVSTIQARQGSFIIVEEKVVYQTKVIICKLVEPEVDKLMKVAMVTELIIRMTLYQ